MSSYASCSAAQRTARIFLSSTFRDFGEERDLLVRKVFPALRARLKDRFVELVDVDLRWGITEEQAERGEVLPICLAEIDRSRPWFVGLLGERYGWIPPADKYPAHVIDGQPWLEQHRGGKSVTELEILHGVLNDPAMAGRALFYFRSADYAQSNGGDFLPSSPEDQARQSDLKNRIRLSGFPVVEDYADPEALAERFEADLWEVLDKQYPADDVPDAFELESLRHEAYAAPRRGLYLGGEGYLKALDQALVSGSQWILIEGQSGGGKSALLSNWVEGLAGRLDDLVVHAHYLGATADASEPVSMVRRLIEHVKRVTGSEEELPADPDELLDALPLWLANASSWAGLNGKRFVFVIDALNGLTGRRDLRWFPSFLPERVHMVVSTLPGEVQEHLEGKAQWWRVEVQPLDHPGARELFVRYLGQFNKELPEALVSRLMEHELVLNPLFLRTLAEELRLFGAHERLEDRLGYYLTSKTVDDLFERVLERVEEDNGADVVGKVMVGLWAARAGLAEEEIRAYADLTPAGWAYIRTALGNALLEGSGRIVFGHDYLRIAVSDRYLEGNNTLQDEGQSEAAIKLRRRAHADLARWFEAHAFRIETEAEQGLAFSVPDGRAAEEIPHQWREARDWGGLKATLTRRDMFEVMVDSRGNQEVLSYWLDLERETNANIERDYEAAWNRWKPDEALEATANLANRLEHFLQHAGYFNEFVEYLAIIELSLCEKVFGENSLGSAGCLNNIAMLANGRGEYEKAELYHRRALRIREDLLGVDNHLTAESLEALSGVLREKGDLADAESIARRALDVFEKTSSKHVVASGLSGVGAIMIERGDFEEAEQFLRRALTIWQEVEGANSPYTASALNNLGILLKKRDLEAAEPLLRSALKIWDSELGPKHPDTAAAMLNLGNLLLAKMDYGNAEPLLNRALLTWESRFGLEHPDVALCAFALANLLSATGDLAGAAQYCRRALLIHEKCRPADHPLVLSTVERLAGILREKGDLDEAEIYEIRLLESRKKVYGLQSPETAASFNNLGYVKRLKGLLEEAEPLYRRAISIWKVTNGIEHSDTQQGLVNLRALLKLLGRKTNPDDILSRGDFRRVVGYAKAIAREAGASELGLLHLVAGIVMARNFDPIWACDIQLSVTVELAEDLSNLLVGTGITVDEELVRQEDKMPLSQELRSLIIEHARSTMSDFAWELTRREHDS